MQIGGSSAVVETRDVERRQVGCFKASGSKTSDILEIGLAATESPRSELRPSGATIQRQTQNNTLHVSGRCFNHGKQRRNTDKHILTSDCCNAVRRWNYSYLSGLYSTFHQIIPCVSLDGALSSHQSVNR